MSEGGGSVQLEGWGDVEATLGRMRSRLAYLRLFDVSAGGEGVDLGRVDWTPGALAASAPSSPASVVEPDEADEALLRSGLAWVRSTASAATHGERRRRFKLMCYGAGGAYLGLCRFASFTIGGEEAPTPSSSELPAGATAFLGSLLTHWQATLDTTRSHWQATFSASSKAQGEENKALREENKALRDRLEDLVARLLNARIDASERTSAADLQLAELQTQRDVANRFLDRVGEAAALVWGDRAGVDPRLVSLLGTVKEHAPELLEVLADPTLAELLKVPGLGRALAANLRGMIDAAKAQQAAGAAPSSSPGSDGAAPPPSAT
jgi:hypothetical protein